MPIQVIETSRQRNDLPVPMRQDHLTGIVFEDQISTLFRNYKLMGSEAALRLDGKRIQDLRQIERDFSDAFGNAENRLGGRVEAALAFVDNTDQWFDKSRMTIKQWSDIFGTFLEAQNPDGIIKTFVQSLEEFKQFNSIRLHFAEAIID